MKIYFSLLSSNFDHFRSSIWAYATLPNNLKFEVPGFLPFQGCCGVLFYTCQLGEWFEK